MYALQLSSAECAVRSRLQWEVARGQRVGHLHMRCNAVHFVGPVNVNVNLNSRAQMLTYSRLVSRRISMFEDGSMLVEMLIPPQPAYVPPVREGVAVDAFSPPLPATVEAVSLRRRMKRFALDGKAADGVSTLEEEDVEEDAADELLCLVKARVREWSCGVHLDLDALLHELKARHATRRGW